MKKFTFFNEQTKSYISLAVSNLLKNITHIWPSTSGTMVIKEDVVEMTLAKADEAIRNAVVITQPSIITPATNTINFVGNIIASQFEPVAGFNAKHTHSEWVFSKLQDFSIVEKSVKNAINLTSINFDPIDRTTPYFVKVRYYSNDFVSAWSEPISVQSTVGYIEKPILEVIDGSVDVKLLPSLRGNAFSVIGATDKHISSDWIVSKTYDFTDIVFERYGDRSNLNTLLLSTKLLPNTKYYAKVRYYGEKYTSDWSNIIEFKTIDRTYTPILIAPQAAIEGNIVEILIDNFDATYMYYITTSTGSVNRTNNKISWLLPYVTDVAKAVINVSAKDVDMDLPESEQATVEINVTNIPTETDQSFIYNQSNIATEFKYPGVIINGSVVNVEKDMMNKLYESTVNVIYLDNRFITVEVGDTLYTDKGVMFTVQSVNDDGDTNTYNGYTYKTKYWITLATALEEVPNKVFVKYVTNVSLPITQSDSETDFRGCSSVKLKAKSISVLDNKVASTVDKVYVNNVKCKLSKGDVVLCDNELITVKDIYHNETILHINNVAEISSGVKHSAIINNDGTLYVSGKNDQNQLGLLGDTTVYTDAKIKALAVACGSYFTLIIGEDNYVYGVGYNGNGELGLGNKNNQPTFVKSELQAKAISAGAFHSLAIGQDDFVYSTGYGNYYQVANDSNGYTKWTKTTLQAKAISAGDYFSAAISLDGYLYVVGKNDMYQLGLLHTDTVHDWTNTNIKAKAVSCGYSYMMFIDENDDVNVVGLNNYGQIGCGLVAIVDRATNIGIKAKYITAGETHSLFLDLDNKVYGSGYNTNGELLDASLGNKNIYTDLTKTALYIKAGNNFSILADENGSVYTSGLNSSGQCALGNTITPIQTLQYTNYSIDAINISEYYEHYWFVPVENILMTPSTVYCLPKVYLNDTLAKPVSGYFTTNTLSLSLADVEFESTRTLTTRVEVPVKTSLFEVSGNILKVDN